MEHQCIKFKVSGRVQGVGFRYHTAYFGLKNGVTGYAKNLWDGDVEVMVCGDKTQIAKMEAYLHQGPPSAKVESLLSEIVEFKSYKGFEIL
ncbi:acylphosphatase [Vibrio sp. 404]|uniref:Acylphosphatase n=1 Tax=Vibrio marinisediminis TaxID=2758441 RepID=A0A7W2FRH7_9VIBR|nr:acylphosphatase [Vibrio marinisediminis]MBA5762933.1 acylphosphatase [Vibrio marinisediminis]